MARFRNLSESQSNVFELIAINQDWGHHPRTLEALEKKGLITKHEGVSYGSGNSALDRIPMKIYRYQVPLDVHIEWCDWCSREDEGLELRPEIVERLTKVTPKDELLTPEQVEEKLRGE